MTALDKILHISKDFISNVEIGLHQVQATFNSASLSGPCYFILLAFLNLWKFPVFLKVQFHKPTFTVLVNLDLYFHRAGVSYTDFDYS